MTAYVGAIDQGTTSTRFVVFDEHGNIVGADQAEHRQIYPEPGWVEHDPQEIWERTIAVITGGLMDAGLTSKDLAAVGLTNQRETTVVWERETGRPLTNAIVWQDTRTSDICQAMAGDEGPDRLREMTGLPLATYFSGPKLRWMLDHVDGLSDAAEKGDVLFGTIDSWLSWNLTGGPKDGVHITDATNASRTMLMNLSSLEWSEDLLDAFGIPASLLPDIRSSSGELGTCTDVLEGVPLTAILGDQQAALFGQACFGTGEAKSTHGTGSFTLLNTGPDAIPSKHGMLTTVGYALEDAAPVYALEGSIAITGALVQWLRDNLGIIDRASQVEELAGSVPDNGGVYLVPAFSGLFAPYWRSDARGVIVGLTRFATQAHIARAALEATAYQTREVLEAMEADAEIRLTELKVDGGMLSNDLLMQFQADVLGVPVVRPRIAETTALGAAYAAGLAVGVWSDLDDLRGNWAEDRRWDPQMPTERREELFARWKMAVERTLDWV